MKKINEPFANCSILALSVSPDCPAPGKLAVSLYFSLSYFFAVTV